MRLWEYSKHVHMEPYALMEKLKGLGFEIDSHMSVLTGEMKHQLDGSVEQLRVLMVTTECVPFIKVGGLADVVGALPKTLNKQGIDVRVVLPKYGLIDEEFKKQMRPIAVTSIQIGNKTMHCGFDTMEYEGVTYYFIDNKYFFNRESLYGHYDDDKRFSFFNRAVLELIDHIEFAPNIIHLNDWHCGMIPLMLDVDYRHKEKYESIKTMMTVHNLQNQGWFDLHVQTDYLQIDEEYFYNGITSQDGSVNFLKTALLTVDYITTVSPRYASEIKDFYFGEGLDGLLRMRKYQLKGILNGIDVDIYNPSTNPHIPYKYDLDSIDVKKKNKRALQIQFGLEERDDIPLIVMVSRLVDQKGLDLLMYAFDEMMTLDFQFIVLGEGEGEYERFLTKMAEQYPEKFKAHIGFNEPLAQLVYAGGDFILLPSLFEPCGLSQMIAMRYGTIAIVRETGGLKDTVTPYNYYTKHGNGLCFIRYNAEDLMIVLEEAVDIYSEQEDMDHLIHEGMTKDFSWKDSVKEYLCVYKELVNK